MTEVGGQSASLILDNVSKAFGSLVAVDSVHLEVRRGEFVTLLGPSGSGKTTTLRVVAGFLRPTTGRVIIDGRDMAGIPPHKRGVGMVFQNYALFPHLTVAQNVSFPLEARGIPRKERDKMVTEVLARVGLSGLGTRLPRELSGGQQQRVAFARAIVYGPPLLLTDEPLGALDKKLREALQLEIRRLHKELGITIVHVTHDQSEALVLSDRIAIFHEGRIEQLGTARDLYDRPRTTFVADFMGESNILRGTVVQPGAAPIVRCDGSNVRGVAPHGPPQVGAEVALVLRPERLSIKGSDEPVAAGTSRLIGRVRQVIYLGDSLKFQLEALGQPVYVRLAAGGANRHVPSVGDEVAIEWRIEDAIVITD